MNAYTKFPVHDNILVAYSVQCEKRHITLFTEYRCTNATPESIDIMFTDVVAYQFIRDSEMGTVIFSIDEVDPDFIYKTYANKFKDELKYGWPGEWAAAHESAAAYFVKFGIRGFQLQSSCGMDGWILAKNATSTRKPTSAG